MAETSMSTYYPFSLHGLNLYLVPPPGIAASRTWSRSWPRTVVIDRKRSWLKVRTISIGTHLIRRVLRQSELEMRAITALVVPIRRFCGSVRSFLQRLNFRFFFYFPARIWGQGPSPPIPEARGNGELQLFSEGQLAPCVVPGVWSAWRDGEGRAKKGNGAGDQSSEFPDPVASAAAN
jgi:hypothetical protein